MSNSGRKKPTSKSVRHLCDELERKRGIRRLQKRFLIVCEDAKSSPNYFRALKKHLNLAATSIEVVGSGSYTQPGQVVEKAISRKSEAKSQRSGTVPFDEVWCVIDGDFGHQAINSARQRAINKGVQLAVSTKCFEYWVLLHFEEGAGCYEDCGSVIGSLKRYLSDYEKGKCDFSEIVKQVDEAARRAKNKREAGKNSGITFPENQNPCSELYKLIENIRKCTNE